MTFDQWCVFVFGFAMRAGAFAIDGAERASRVLHVNGLRDGRFGAVAHNGATYAFDFDTTGNRIVVKCNNGEAWSGSPSGVATAIKGANESGPRFFALPTEGKGSGRGAGRGEHKANGNGNVGARAPGEAFAAWAAQAAQAARDLRAVKSAGANAMFAKVDALSAMFGDDDPSVMALRARAIAAVDAVDAVVKSAVDFAADTDNG